MGREGEGVGQGQIKNTGDSCMRLDSRLKTTGWGSDKPLEVI